MPKNKKNKNNAKKTTAKQPPTKRGGRTQSKTILIKNRFIVGDTGFSATDIDTNNVVQATLNHVNLTLGSTEYKIRNVKTNVYRYGNEGIVTANVGPIALDANGTLASMSSHTASGCCSFTTPSTTGWQPRKRIYVNVVAPHHSVVETSTLLEVRDAPAHHL